jgi:hypothetical protein
MTVWRNWPMLVWLLATAPAVAATTVEWPDASYNPQPASGDLVLPLPCGVGAVADLAVPLGDGSAPEDFNSGARGAFLAAPFVATSGSQIYWIGKYTVTQAQYDALAEHCPAGVPSRLPQTNVSWFDAMNFAASYTSWLMAYDHQALPQRGSATGFLRLPTEAEWEYAARGGDAVTLQVYEQKAFVQPANLADYAVAGEDFSSGTPSPVGSREPNPLGLYDMLGNVQQWVFDLYSPVRLGRLGGLTGGLLVRGGSYMTPLADLSAASRQEVLPFDPATGQPAKLSSVGFRLVIGVTTGEDAARAQELHAALHALAQARIDPSKQPLRALPQLEAETADPQVRAGLEAASAALAKAGDSTLHAEIEASLSLAFVIHERQAALTYMEQMRDSPDYADLRQSSNYQDVLKNIAGTQDVIGRLLDSDVTLLQSISSTSTCDQIDETMVAEYGLFEQRADSRAAFARVTQGSLDKMCAGQYISAQDILARIEAVP